MPDQSHHSRPPLDPACRAVLETMQAAGAGFQQNDVAAIRTGYERNPATEPPPTPELARVDDLTLPAGEAEPALALRIYRPVAAETPAPVAVFFHGGGWALGDLESHDAVCRIIAQRADAVVVAVDYRRSPEHAFPAAVDDCLRAVRFVAEEADVLGVDAGRMALVGDSAGGNLAAVAARRLSREDGLRFALQALIYPATDFTASGGSLDENGRGLLLTAGAIAMFRDWYLPDPASWQHPDASPLKADDLAGLPPALVQVCGYDPLRDEGVAYAERLRAAGVPVQLVEYPTMLHGFLRMARMVPAAHVAFDDIAAALRQAFRR